AARLAAQRDRGARPARPCGGTGVRGVEARGHVAAARSGLGPDTAPTMNPGTRGLFVRMFSGAVVDQALLSASSLAVGLLLIRHASELQYGYFVLVTSVLMLTTSLQSAFIGPAMI